MIELYTETFEQIRLQKGVNVFSFTTAEQSELFAEYIEEAFLKRKKSSHVIVRQEERERLPKDYYAIEVGIGKQNQEIKLHDVLLEKIVYDFYHDEQMMKLYYEFQCQQQMFLNQLEVTNDDYTAMFHAENFQEKLFLKQLEFDLLKEDKALNASDKIQMYCDIKMNMNDLNKEQVLIIYYPETSLGIKELVQLAMYVRTVQGYVIVVTNAIRYFLDNDVRVNILNERGCRVDVEALMAEYKLFDSTIEMADVICIVEYYISGNSDLMLKRYENLVKSSGIDEVNMI